MDNNESRIANFASMFGISVEEAKFYMETSNYDEEMASDLFLNSDERNDDEHGNEVPLPPPTYKEHVSKESDQPEQEGSKHGVSSMAEQLRLSDAESTKREQEEGRQAFFVGGGGQQVLGPPKKKTENLPLIRGEADISEFLKKVKESGAEEVDPRTLTQKSSSSSSVFKGKGRRLDQEIEGGEEMDGENEEREITVIMSMWNNGFTLDEDNEVRSFEDEENMEFLRTLRSGEIPVELLRKYKNKIINVQLEDHHDQDFVQKKRNKPAFGGKGVKLGYPSSSSSTPHATESDPISNLNDSSFQAPLLRENEPQTQLRIRLADGTSLVGSFNHDSTVSDVIQFIKHKHVPSRTRGFSLMTTFPSNVLSNERATLKSLNLLGGTVMQKF